MATGCGENAQSYSKNASSNVLKTQQAPPPPFTRKGPGREFAVLPIAEIDRELQPAFLSESEVDAVYEMAQMAVNEYNIEDKESGQPTIKLDDYRLQLIAITTATQQKEVIVYAFCSGPLTNWKTKLLQVRDGGSCYFRVKVNLTTGAWSDLLVNGEA